MAQFGPLHATIVLDAVRSSSGAASSAVVASWCRSACHHGLDPERSRARERIDAGGIARLRERQAPLLAAAIPVLDQTFRAVGRAGCCVVLTDASGVILERRADAADVAAFGDAGLAEGAQWSEAAEGTNGIGTCLYEDQPVVIHRDQHFSSRNIGISCADAPVHDPFGHLVAALDVSSCRRDHDAATAAMVAAVVRDAARRIERDLFCRHFADARIVFLSDDPSSGTALLAVDRDDLVVGATRTARHRLHLGDAAFADTRSVGQVLGTGEAMNFGDGERVVLRRALASAGGNASHAARLLGISRATLYRRLNRSGLHR